MIKSDQCLLVMGRRGCGKSYLAKKLQEIFPRKIIFDSLHEYGPEEGETVNSFLEFCEAITRLDSMKPDHFTLIVKFDIESEVSLVEFDQMLKMSYYFGNVLVVIEEVQNFSNVHLIPHWLRNLLLTGRHQNIAMLFTTQRPGELHKTILSQCQHIFCGNIVEGNDLRYISSFLRQDAKNLVQLPERQFLYFGPHGISKISNDLKTIQHSQHTENT